MFSRIQIDPPIRDNHMSWGYFQPYVPVAARRAQAAREVTRRQKQGQSVSPVKIEGLKITRSFWGNSWCHHLESFSDYANRLPRGRTYVRNGSVVDLQIGKGSITALVSGSELYEISIQISELPAATWKTIKKETAGRIGSLVELLRGKLSKEVMEIVTQREHGLFPKPREIQMSCSCPDSARLCKHLAAVLYGVGHRIDNQPELLFQLRHVDHMQLIEGAAEVDFTKRPASSGSKKIATSDLSDLFGIEMAEAEKPSPKTKTRTTQATAKTAKTAKKSPRQNSRLQSGASSVSSVTESSPSRSASVKSGLQKKSTPKTAESKVTVSAPSPKKKAARKSTSQIATARKDASAEKPLKTRRKSSRPSQEQDQPVNKPAVKSRLSRAKTSAKSTNDESQSASGKNAPPRDNRKKKA